MHYTGVLLSFPPPSLPPFRTSVGVTFLVDGGGGGTPRNAVIALRLPLHQGLPLFLDDVIAILFFFLLRIAAFLTRLLAANLEEWHPQTARKGGREGGREGGEEGGRGEGREGGGEGREGGRMGGRGMINTHTHMHMSHTPHPHHVPITHPHALTPSHPHHVLILVEQPQLIPRMERETAYTARNSTGAKTMGRTGATRGEIYIYNGS